MRADILLFTGQIQKPGFGQKLGQIDQSDQNGQINQDPENGIHGSADFHSILESLNADYGPEITTASVSEIDKNTLLLNLAMNLESDDLKNMMVDIFNKDQTLNIDPDESLKNSEILKWFSDKFGKDLLSTTLPVELGDELESKEISQQETDQKTLTQHGNETLQGKSADQPITAILAGNMLNQSDIKVGQTAQLDNGMGNVSLLIGNSPETGNAEEKTLSNGDNPKQGQDAGSKEKFFETILSEKKDTTGIYSGSSELKKTDQNIVKEPIDKGKGENQLKVLHNINHADEKGKTDLSPNHPESKSLKQDGLMNQIVKDQEHNGNMSKATPNLNNISVTDGEPVLKDTNITLSNSIMIQKEEDVKVLTKTSEPVQNVSQKDTMGQIVEKAAIHLKNGHSEARIELKPEFLGQVKMQIATENNQVSVKIIAELPVVKEIIENNINQLKADLQNQGLDVDKLDVFVANDSKHNRDHGKDLHMKDPNNDEENGNEDDSDQTIDKSEIHLTGNIADDRIDYFV